jgi:phage terminase large subunit
MKYYHQYGLKPNLLVVRRYMNTNWNSTRSQLIWAINKLGVANLWKIPKSEHTLTYLPSNQVILFKGFDDAQSITSITVADGHLCWVWIEEAFQITSEDSFNKLDMSIRGQLPFPLFKQFVITFNPWTDKSWLKRRFFDVKSDNVLALTTTYKCNEFLSDDDRQIFEEMKIQNPRRYSIEGEGNWGIADGVIYTNWEVKRFDIQRIVEENANNPHFVSCNGMDFGYNDPTAMIGAFADKRKYEIYIYYEFYQTLMENRKIAKKIIDDGFGKSIIRADRADPRTINELKILGLAGIRPASKRGGTGDIVSGIQKLQDYKIIVHPRCINMIESLSNYSWKKDRLTDKITNEPEHEYSHCCDALRYGTEELHKFGIRVV